MTLSPIPEVRKAQVTAIGTALDVAPKIQDDLKAKFGYGENKFFDLDLIEYRMNNSRLDIADDLDVKSLYGLTTEDVAEESVSRAFRGHHNEDFMPDYQFDGLLGKVTNDYIQGIRAKINGRKGGLIGGRKGYANGLGNLTPEELSELGRKGYANGLANLTPEERSENGRKGGLIGALASAEAQGNHLWSLEEIAEIGELKYGEGLTWNDTTSEMNEKYGEDWATATVKRAYHRNKDLLSDEEE